MQFASCPPAFGLLLYLRKLHRHSMPVVVRLARLRSLTNFATAADTVCLPQRSKGGARSAGDMSGGRYAVADAGPEKLLSNQKSC
jgi:hypothetical protein